MCLARGVGGMPYGGTATEKSTSAEHRSFCLIANCRHDVVPADVPTTATLPMPRTSAGQRTDLPVPADLSSVGGGLSVSETRHGNDLEAISEISVN